MSFIGIKGGKKAKVREIHKPNREGKAEPEAPVVEQLIPMVLPELVSQSSPTQQNDMIENKHDHSWGVAGCTLENMGGNDQNDKNDFHVFHDDTQEDSCSGKKQIFWLKDSSLKE